MEYFAATLPSKQRGMNNLHPKIGRGGNPGKHQMLRLGRMILQRHRRNAFAVASASVLSLLAGCASPGPPRPPSLKLPATVTDLAAERIGDTVHLHWTTPSRTTDGLDIKDQLTAELCRELHPAQPHPVCTSFTRLPVKPGPSQVGDLLPAELATGPATLIAYRIQIWNASNRAASASHPVFAAAGSAPPPVSQLRGTPNRNGATLEWSPQPTPGEWVELDRILLPTFSQTTKPAEPTAARNPLPLTPNLPTEVHLQTPKDTPDAGGTLDRTAQKTETYAYQAQRVRAVTLQGHALELRSATSPTITIHIADTFPPLAPTELAAVPGDKPGTIDLSWEPVADSDLAGYNVYRRSANSSWQKLTPAPITNPAYTDTTSTAGEHYIYRITALDTTGNESQFSNEAEETARNH